MPQRPMKLCSSGGCRTVVPGGVSRCDRHEAAYQAREAARKREYEKRRPTAARRGYDAAWSAVRKQFLAAHPTCSCGAPATEAHHKLSVREHPEMRLHWSALEALCKSCHSRVTGTTQGGWAK